MATKLLPPPLLIGSQRAFSISSFWEGRAVTTTAPMERRLLNLVLPPWQREFTWTEAQQVRFIEGVFLGLNVGSYVVNGRDYETNGDDKPMSGWLIDGQQRITSIARFINDEIAIFGNIHYSELPLGEKRRRFDNIVFPCVELEYQEDENLLKELYLRLNFGGTAHTQADRELVEKVSIHD
ncbi:DUF262 domain-containing protein [Pseudomonas putida]|uniref:DUF262 domain-containing protein n=1 Tax=Pseudomonas putida TaxID=303 RepID=A0A8I1JHJ6_PSEPU|nr:DUF262 domain-containing protein [Pseudomonas putida]MBI6882756.1 DUF262 domain-containing protein [Pseudomonas putida]